MKLLKQSLFLMASLIPALTTAEADGPSIAISEYQKQEWHVEDGLSQSNVRSIIQARNRLLLIGNSEGIMSFDGVHFAPMRVNNSTETANEPVNALLISKNGDLWIGTDDRGVIRQSSQKSINISEDSGFHQERVRALFEDSSGSIWVATHNGVERITGNKMVSFDSLGLVPGDITQPFAEDAHGNVFIVTSKGLFRSKGSQIHPYKAAMKELGDVTSISGDVSGVIWVGHAKGLSKLTPAGQEGFEESIIPSVHGPITSLLVDHDKNLWVGTKGHGVCRVSPTGMVTHWTTENGLSDDTIRTLFQDDEGNLWIGTLSGGLNRWRKSTLVPFGPPEGLPNTFAANVLGDRRGDIWLGTWGSGLLRIRKGKLQRERIPGLADTDPIRSLAEDQRGNVWIGTWFDGLYRYDGTSYRHFLTGRESPSNAVSVIYSDKKNGLWIGTYKGLIRFPEGTPDMQHSETFLPEMLITSVVEDVDGSIVVGTFKGLFRLKNSVVEPITTKDGLSNDFILSVSTDTAGGMWVGAKGGGIDFIQGQKATHVPTSAGIPGFPIFAVQDDGHGMLWMSTTRGLLRVPLDQMHELVAGKRETVDSFLLGKNDGMRSSECGGMSRPPSTRTKDGELWFATAKGFVHTNPSKETFVLPAVEARIVGLQLDHNDAPVPDKILLSPGMADMDLHFDAIRLSNPSQIQFRYKLDGYDKEWTTVSGRHAHYKHLPPGQYRFVVSAHDAGHPWVDHVAEATVVQKPFLYQTAWFYVFALLILAAIVVGLFRWRLSRAKGRIRLIMEERNRIAREWHDTLMASLAAISWQLEATRDRFGKESSGAAQSLDLARNMVRHSQTEARRIIWDLQDDPAPVGALSEVLTKVLDGMSTRTNVNAQLKITGEEKALSPIAIHHLACICQEAITNAVRHATPTAIYVGMEYNHSRMTLSVKDDGCGFQTRNGAVPGHFGLSVMEERARKLGGGLRIQSTPGIGTEIVVDIPTGSEA